jgi:hypothetical protein
MSITQPVCILVVLGIQHSMRMRDIVVCSLPALQYSYTLSHKWHDFRKKKNCSAQNVCFDFLYNFCVKQFSFKEEKSII